MAYSRTDFTDTCEDNKGYLYIIECYNETEKFFKIGITKFKDILKLNRIIKDQKDLSIYVEELKQNNIFVYTRYHLHNIEFSKINLNDNIQKLLLLLNKITKKYEKQKNTVFLILKFEILLDMTVFSR